MTLSKIKRVLVPTDLQSLSVRPFIHGLRLAAARRADLTVVHLSAEGRPDWRRVPSAVELLWDWRVLPPAATEEDYDRLAKSVRFQAIVGHLAGPTLARAIRHKHPDLVVLGTHARAGFDRLVQGSVAQRIFSEVGVAHLFFGPESKGFISGYDGFVDIKRVLIPLDPGEAQVAVDAAEWFLNQFAEGVLDLEYLWVGAEDAIPPFEPIVRPGWVGRTSTRQGDVAQAIVACAEEMEVDLIVMATRGRDSISDVLKGSKTERALQHARCPVLALPVRGD